MEDRLVARRRTSCLTSRPFQALGTAPSKLNIDQIISSPVLWLRWQSTVPSQSRNKQVPIPSELPAALLHPPTGLSRSGLWVVLWVLRCTRVGRERFREKAEKFRHEDAEDHLPPPHGRDVERRGVVLEGMPHVRERRSDHCSRKGSWSASSPAAIRLDRDRMDGLTVQDLDASMPKGEVIVRDGTPASAAAAEP